MISITIPTFNNVKYLKLCIDSLEKNSHFKNEILLHINDGSDGTLEFAKQKKLKFTQSSTNEGLCVGMNKPWWEGLSKTDQMIVKAAATVENDMMLAEYNAKNGAALEKLIREQGVQLREFNDDVYDAFGDAAEEVFEETRAHSDIANRIHESFAKARREVGAWNKISDQAYVSQRNRVLGV